MFQRPSQTPSPGAVVAAVITLVCVGWPALAVAWSVVGFSGGRPAAAASGLEPALTPAPAWGLLASTLAWSGGIGIGATIIAWPAAWVVRRYGWGVLPLMLTPLMLPSYLAYSGYSTLRAAGTPVGNLIEHFATRGYPNLPSYTGRFLAGAGLVLWGWPIAAVILGAAIRQLDQDVLDSLRPDASPLRRHLQVLGMSKVALFGSVGAVALVMMGSAVPLHLAQVPTYAIKVWLDLTLTPTSAKVWLAAWPLLVIALLAAAVSTRLLLRWATTFQDSTPPSRKAALGPVTGTVLVWGGSVLVPLGLFVFTVRDFHQYAVFWKISTDAVINSGLVAAGVAGVGVVLAAGCWQAASAARSGRTSPLLAACLGVLIFAGLVPGVLVGTAWVTTTQMDGVRWLGDSLGVMVLAHVTRFGFVAALMGCWLAAVEPKAEREQRALDGGIGVGGWLRACLPVQGGALVGAGLMMGALSLHEIEAAVVLQPPGAGSLAQTMLAHLHQLRMQDVSSASVMVVLVGLIVATLAAVAGWVTARQIR